MIYGLTRNQPLSIFLDAQSKVHVQSKIIFIYQDVENHNMKFLKLRDTAFGISSIGENKFQVGDSISKKKGSLKIEHYRKGNLIEILDYHTIGRR